MFCAPTRTDVPTTARATSVTAIAGGHSTRSTPSGAPARTIARASSTADCGVVCIFQLPATRGRRESDITLTPALSHQGRGGRIEWRAGSNS